LLYDACLTSLCLMASQSQNLGTFETKARTVLAVYSRIMEKNSPRGAEHSEVSAQPNRSGASSASIGSRIPPTAPMPARPPSSVTSRGTKDKPVLNASAIRDNDSSSNEDSDGSPVVPLSREQLQAQLYATGAL